MVRCVEFGPFILNPSPVPKVQRNCDSSLFPTVAESKRSLDATLRNTRSFDGSSLRLHPASNKTMPSSPTAEHPERSQASVDATTHEPATPAESPSGLKQHPTHRLRGFVAGNNSVQFFYSSKEHQYDIEDVRAGDGAWQGAGVDDASTIKDNVRSLCQRQHDQHLQAPATGSVDNDRFKGQGRTVQDSSNTSPAGSKKYQQ